ncbi:MAG TPA: DUF4168 domain-containing protein [Leptolyngbyaceae cyanobacterium M65_K2018_010]|nr:DUF4168 domain-containing protein [Leptolyngbyaceae cyanobacterium M65_K2018_010]
MTAIQGLFSGFKARCSLTQLSRSVVSLGLVILFLISLPLIGVTPAEAAGADSAAPQTNLVAPEAPTPPSSSQPDASTVPSETVSRFVSAYLAVVKLIESREQSLQSAETETESRQMQQEIQAEAIGLIQAHDLTLQAYWELLGLANSDPEFRERVLAQIEEASP